MDCYNTYQYFCPLFPWYCLPHNLLGTTCCCAIKPVRVGSCRLSHIVAGDDICYMCCFIYVFRLHYHMNCPSLPSRAFERARGSELVGELAKTWLRRWRLLKLLLLQVTLSLLSDRRNVCFLRVFFNRHTWKLVTRTGKCVGRNCK